MKWQKIETYQDNGDRLSNRVIVYWDGNISIAWLETHYKYGRVWIDDSCVDFGGYLTPTHWMPLPEPPNETD
jgi:hypothetical protein